MTLYTPYFFLKKTDCGTQVCHNCNGGINFAATDDIDDRTKRLVELAIEEGKRLKALEIRLALGLRGAQ